MPEKVTFRSVVDKLEKDIITPYNFYNVDIGIDQYYADKHYRKKLYDIIDNTQILSKCFLDIEVFMNHQEGLTFQEMTTNKDCQINAISHYYSSENCYYLYVVPPKDSKITEEELRQYCLIESRKKYKIINNKGKEEETSYLTDQQDLKVKFFNDGISLTEALWKKILDNDPSILSSFNGDSFDYPYMYHYLLRYFHNEETVSRIMSKFGIIKLEKSHDRAGNEVTWLRFPEFVLMDMMYLYKSREDFK